MRWLDFTGRNVPSSKNSKQWTGTRLIKSELCQEYERWSAPLFLMHKRAWKRNLKLHEYPVTVEFYFMRDSHRRFDYINITQLVADLMVKFGYIEDDDADHFNPVFTGYEVTGKDKSGFRMRIKDEGKQKETQIQEQGCDRKEGMS